MIEFSKHWISSKQPNKQRKYRFNAPLHIKGRFLGVSLSKPLRAKYNKRSMRVVVGDKVKIIAGTYKGREDKVDSVSVIRSKVYLASITVKKRDGNLKKIPFEPSNLQIVDLKLDDKKRKAILERKKTEAEK